MPSTAPMTAHTNGQAAPTAPQAQAQALAAAQSRSQFHRRQNGGHNGGGAQALSDPPTQSQQKHRRQCRAGQAQDVNNAKPPKPKGPGRAAQGQERGFNRYGGAFRVQAARLLGAGFR